ncbi:MAG: magnesium-translocating P-type ATPase [Methanomicrobiales archaeon]|nr:magnesium-translocating P-type ATPase [Methanomicrobiales archaeon]
MKHGIAENSTVPGAIDFHTLPAGDLLAALQTSAQGLASEQIQRRRELYGSNDISRVRKRSAVIRYLEHFKNILILILLLAVSVSVFVGEIESAFIIFIIVIASVTLDFYQENRAEIAAELLRQRIISHATVIREGRQQEVPIVDLVPGDVILLSAGDIVPADAVLLSERDLYVNQSALTGEPYPVEKHAIASPPETPVIEAENYVFLGTSVVSGIATAVVTRTGMATEFGRVAQTLVDRPQETEFERGLKDFSFLMSRFVFGLVIFVFFVNALFRHDVLESLLFAVALAVGMTPELLPMILSLNLSKGAVAMAEKGAIVKHPESIQNFGGMDILCTDKTGTLTENRIALIEYLDPEGRSSEKVLYFAFLNSYFHSGVRNPLDEAIVTHHPMDGGEYQKIDEIPFDFVRRRLSIVVSRGAECLLISKGAPEEILRICSTVEKRGTVTPMTNSDSEGISSLYGAKSTSGFRTLVVCYRTLEPGERSFSVEDERDMTFIGLITFIDPPKETARESLQQLAEAGIELKILTGDNELVTRRIASLIGLEVKGVITGGEIEQMDRQTLSRVVEGITLFCRVTPVQKNRIISALRQNGHVVGFRGDGINDAPSLREADVGISVQGAVDIARESSDIILLEQDLRILREGVIEGRRTFGNTMKYILMGSSSNFGNMFSVAGASLFLPFLPMLPIQILLNNLLYDVSESTIPMDNVDRSYVDSPKRWDMGFIKKFILVFGPVSSLFDFLTFFILLFIFSAQAALFQTAWFIESICTQTLVIFVIRTSIVPFYRSKPSAFLLGSTFLVVIVACILPFTFLGSIFGFVNPPLSFYAVLAGLVAGYLVLVEVVKRWFYCRYSSLVEQRVVIQQSG